MDAFKNPIAKIKRRLKLELQVWPMVIHCIKEERRIEKQGKSPKPTYLDRYMPPFLLDRKIALWKITADRAVKIRMGLTISESEDEWYDYVQDQLFKTEKKYNDALLNQTHRYAKFTNKVYDASIEKSKSIRQIENHIEKIVDKRVELAMQGPEISPLLIDPLQALAEDLKDREILAGAAKEEMKSHLSAICRTFECEENYIPKDTLKTLMKLFIPLRSFLNKADAKNQKMIEEITLLESHWTSRFAKEPYTSEDDRIQSEVRNALLLLDCEADELYFERMYTEGTLNTKIADLFFLVRQFKSIRDALDENNKANTKTLEKLNGLVETWIERLEDLVKLRGELARLNNVSL